MIPEPAVASEASVTSPVDMSIPVDVWSDVVCPWCYIGKRRFEQAAEMLAGEIRLDVTVRPFQLDPTVPPGSAQPVAEVYARKFGGPEQARAMIARVTDIAAADGLTLRLDRAVRANTLLAHRLLWLAGRPGSPTPQGVLEDRLFRAYFHDGANVGDPDVLAGCAAEVGFDRAAVDEFLAGDHGRDEVADWIARAGTLGVTAVPTYVVAGRWAIPGAQDTDTFVAALRRAAELLAAERGTADPRGPAPVAAGPACEDDACGI